MDLAEITDFIALDNPEGAYQFEEELLEQHTESAALHCLRRRPDLPGDCAPALMELT